MKKVLSAIVATGLILAGTSCLAAEGMYVKGILKWAIPGDPEVGSLDTDMSNGYGWGGAFGWNIDQFRVEGEITTQKTDLDAVGFRGNDTAKGIGSGDLRMNTYMINGYWDIPVNEAFSFYLLAGLGYGTAELSIYNVDGTEGGFTWKGGLGVSYNFNSNMAADFGWEYVSMEDADFDDVSVNDLYSNNIVAAFRFSF